MVTGLMLAEASKKVAPTPDAAVKTLESQGWMFEPKLDGQRCLATSRPVKLITRSGRDCTDRFPEVVEELQSLPGDWVLDGELVVANEHGVPDFQLVATREKASHPARVEQLRTELPAQFVVFDLLSKDLAEIRGWPMVARRFALEEMLGNHVSDRVVLNVCTPRGAVLWDHVQANQMEGVMAKNPHGLYRPGRSSDWVKIKVTRSASLVVTGYEPGNGKHEGLVGALLLAAYDDNGRLVDIGKVGTGFSDAQRVEYRDALDFLDKRGAPPTLVAEIEFANLTHDGTPRFPSFKGIRTDVDVTTCTTRALEEA